MSNQSLLALSAGLPILLVTGLMLAGWGGTRAGPIGWTAAIAVAVLGFGAGPELLLWSQAKGLALAVWVLYIVWSALLLAEVAGEAGAFDVIAEAVGRLTAQRDLQLLLLAWVFSAFLQGVTGFGVPVAIVAPLLVGLGFPAMTAVVATSIGHSWAVTFGSVASSMYALLAVTGLEAAAIAPASAALLGAAALACGIAVAWVGGGWPALRRAWPALAAIGSAMALAHYVLATHRSWPLASFGAASIGLAVAALVSRLPRYRVATQAAEAVAVGDPNRDGRSMSVAAAAAPYLVLGLLVALAQLPALVPFFDALVLELAIPATGTRLGWTNAAGSTRGISVFGHTGALIAYAALLAGFLHARAGRYPTGAGRRILTRTLAASRKPTLSIVVLVCMAQTMSDSGMTYALAEAIGRVTGSAFPLGAALIGALGAFITGSNTNSNVLFGALQQQTAALLGLNLPWVLGAQNVGGALGSAFAPAKIVVGVSTVGLAGQEGAVLKRLLIPGLTIVLLAGLAAWALA
ncbi:MAG: L-lactate permease [Caldilineae bacterium]|nr:L-lactate permease [Caldilineae bacterium]